VGIVGRSVAIEGRIHLEVDIPWLAGLEDGGCR